MVPCTRRRGRKREGRQGGEVGSRRTRRAGDRVARPHGPLWKKGHATPKVHSQHQTSGGGKEVGRGTELVGEADKEEEVQDAGEDEAAGSGGASPQKTGRAVPPAQDRALPHRAIPGMDEELGYGGLWVVPVQDTGPGTPAQALQEVEDAAEDAVGRSLKGNGKGQGPLHGPGPDGRRAMHRSSPRLPTHHEGRKQGGTCAVPPKPGEDGEVAREGAEEMEAGGRA